MSASGIVKFVEKNLTFIPYVKPAPLCRTDLWLNYLGGDRA